MITKKMNNGYEIPTVGFGVWKVLDEEAPTTVQQAIETGYRLIDTAKIYGNETGVGKAIQNSNIAREDLFITTKLWNSDQGYESTLRAFDESLEKLQLEYVDLYLIHWPTPMYDNYVESYKALEEIYKSGRAKAIGVCNFDIEHLERIMDECEIMPAVNQVECHPYLQQKELRAFCEKNGIEVQAYSPLMNGKTVLQDPVIQEIATQYGKTPAQIILRWHLQNDILIIPKTVTPSRMKENLDLFSFELSETDLDKINELDRNERVNAVPSEMDRR